MQLMKRGHTFILIFFFVVIVIFYGYGNMKEHKQTQQISILRQLYFVLQEHKVNNGENPEKLDDVLVLYPNIKEEAMIRDMYKKHMLIYDKNETEGVIIRIQSGNDIFLLLKCGTVIKQ